LAYSNFLMSILLTTCDSVVHLVVNAKTSQLNDRDVIIRSIHKDSY